jgi:hypothetical protein
MANQIALSDLNLTQLNDVKKQIEQVRLRRRGSLTHDDIRKPGARALYELIRPAQERTEQVQQLHKQRAGD